MLKADSTKKIKNNLGQILKDKKMTAEELASKINITAASVSRFKNSKANISMDNIFDIIKVLDITLGELFGEVPVNYKDIINIKFINNINKFQSCQELFSENNFKLFSISKNLLNVLEITVDLSNIIITKVSNNAMYETISTTDFVIINLDSGIDKDGLYLIQDQNTLEIRRIEIIQEEEKVKISIDNQKHLGSISKNYNREEADKLVCGKVLKIIKRSGY